ncbi:NRDE family protein [Vibrio sp. E150_018]
MCTLTWRVTPSGYQILFNRDEQKTRSIALPPQAFSKQDSVALMPIDPDGQGTWVATNNHGLSLCLLNFYQGQTPSSAKQSRGQLVRQLAYCQNYAQVAEQLTTINWSDYPPFSLLIFDPEKLTPNDQIPTIIWDGLEVFPREQSSPITSSSLEFEQVQASRLAYFNHQAKHRIKHQTKHQTQPSFSQLRDYHMSHSPQAGAHSVCMHRDDAQTVSLTMINVDANRITMDYQPGSPCQSQAIHSLTEPRIIKTEIPA